MAKVDVVMPKMGESVMEGTVLSWTKQVGDEVELDETLLEISTDKVDSEVPSPAAGRLAEIIAPEGETVEVGAKIAVIETDVDAPIGGDGAADGPDAAAAEPEVSEEAKPAAPNIRPGPKKRPKPPGPTRRRMPKLTRPRRAGVVSAPKWSCPRWARA